VADRAHLAKVECSAPAAQASIKAKTYRVIEQEGYVYVCLQPGEHTPTKPRLLSQLITAADVTTKRHSGVLRTKAVVRLQNRFQNSLANCVENYIDVPHTAYVHRGIFRKPKGEEIRTSVTRADGEVHISYHGERLNLGTFGWFLNPQGKEIVHTDHFYAPNVTSVHYHLPCGYRYSITSQSIPVSPMETLVYTDISYDFGFWTAFAGWLVRRQAEKVIMQDIEILNEQGTNIEKYGERFYPTSADAIHTLTSEIIEGLKDGIAPAQLSVEKQEITFCV
jgi:phenylpropionate dioxygenase-like ring-hydroxylating dioxygenase large terminal subunit